MLDSNADTKLTQLAFLFLSPSLSLLPSFLPLSFLLVSSLSLFYFFLSASLFIADLSSQQNGAVGIGISPIPPAPIHTQPTLLSHLTPQ